ncbi:RHS repeat-associated protein [Rheinheimera pacifica]|uniref:RHS repeat-associated core domain-containing protein n=1 Tax=Rheinheimera pacifica TaxID=173990 RepID=UPI0028637D60|nr:RHS repeat-associated core domain-containing protein [Rheinheimera pacifica]MDR6984470.1 RHS repeat-associated protein [Rheinheimera pacifica]
MKGISKLIFAVMFFLYAGYANAAIDIADVWVDDSGNYYYAVPVKHVVLTDDLAPAVRLFNDFPFVRVIPGKDGFLVESLSRADFDKIRHLLQRHGKRFKGDFDGDGQPDILLQTNSGLDILITKRKGGVYSARSFPVGQTLSSESVLQDFNADGRTDILNSAGMVSYALDTGFTPQYERGDYVGSLAGEHSVTPSGEFTYSLPITTAPATGNLIPSIALTYSSAAPNGHLGRGWSIGGLRIITRCEQNLELNGNISKVDFSSSDRFCLDGQQLIVNNGHTYGGNGAEYRAVQDNFEKVISRTASGVSGPVSFEVKDTSGNTFYFGRVDSVSDALILNSNNQAYLWALKKVQDASGNYYTYHYSRVSQSLEFHLTSIKYSGNGNIAPSNEIVFSYDDTRADKEATYLAGHMITLSKRLNTITSKVNGLVLRTYTLGYGGPSSSNVLASIKACDSTNKCLTPTIFTWNLPSGFGEYGGQFSRTSRYKGHQMWDYNGDGLLDIAYVRNDRGSSTDHLFLIQNTGSNLVQTHTYNDIASKSFRNTWKIVDLDKDGKDEIIYRGAGGFWYQIKHSGSGFTNTKLNITAATSDAYSHYVDMDGDGLPELLHTVNNKLSVQKGTKAGVAAGFQEVTVNLNNPGGDYTVALVPFDKEDNTLPATDFNGDGKADFIVQVRTSYIDPNPDPCTIRGNCCDPNQPWLCQEPRLVGTMSKNLTIPDSTHSLPISVVAQETQTAVAHYVEQPVVTEIMQQSDIQEAAVGVMNSSYSTVQWKVLTSNSATSLSEYATIGTVALIDKVIPVDINADGLADVAYRQASNKEWFIRINNGAGFNAAISTGVLNEETLKFYGSEKLSVVYKNGVQFCYKSLQGNIFLHGGCFGYDGTDREYWSTNFLDMNGDGAPDMLDFHGRYHLKFLPDTGFRRITKITNGFGEETIVGYSNLNDPSVHNRKTDGATKNWGNGYLVRDLKGPLPVVRTVKTGTDALAYHYTGGKMQVGRGLLGFEQVQITSFASATRTTTTYRQDGDYRGSVAEVLVEIQVGEYSPPTNPCDERPMLCEPPPCSDSRFCEEPRMIQSYSVMSSTPIWRVKSKSTASYALKANSFFSTNSNKTQARFVYPTSTTTWRYDTDRTTAEVLTTQTQSITSIDSFAQPLTQVETVSDAYTTARTTTTNSYFYNETSLYGGRLYKTAVKKERTNKVGGTNVTQPVITLTNSFGYDSAGRLASQTSDSGIVTSYVLNSFGLITSETATASGMAPRTITRGYDSNGRYLMAETNALGQTTSYDYTNKGLLNYTQYANGQRVYIDYNSLGRLIAETTTPGNNTSKTGSAVLNKTKTQYWCDSSGIFCPATALYYENETATGQPSKITSYDSLGRVVRTASRGFANNWIWVDTEYDGKGRKISETVPHFSGTTNAAVSQIFYDMQGRVNRLVKPDGSEWLTSYDGLAVISTAPNSKTQTEIKNSLGDLVSVTDADGKTALYQYDANGKSTELIGPSNNKIIVTYDKWGNKKRVTDPDAGITNYNYNTFHELISQSDANGNVITYTYDILGRQKTMLRKKPGGVVEHDVETIYDSGAYAVGQISSVEDKKTGYKTNYYYDTFARVRQQATRFDDGTVYNQHWAYDNLGRLHTETDATGGGVIYNYNTNHWLNSIDDKDIKDAAGNVRRHWQANTIDAYGNVTQDKLGAYISRSHTFDQNTGLIKTISSSSSGQGALQNWLYDWDNLGNLKYRHDYVTGNRESFTYDGLNRLKTSRITSPKGNTNTDINYNTLGNITSKTGVGNYYYESSRPHAVTRVTGTRANSYQYDANGNMIQDNQRRLTYNSFNKPTLITKGGYQVEFYYSPAGDKYKRLEFGGRQGKLIPIMMGDITTFIPLHTETRYVGSVEFIRYGGSEWLQKRYIGDKAVVSRVASQSVNQSTVRYLLTDHLGSTHVITNATGVKEDTMSFDAFGARRDAESWAMKHEEASSGLLTSNITLRGFTGHEQIDEVGLVHMGGRVYDPILGRFLQADPFVQQPNNIQNFNRYSYVLNNPLNKTDPSGYFFQMLVVWAVQYVAAASATAAIGTALSVALTAYQYYGYAQMAIGAIKAIEGGGTAMANFAGGMAKGLAKGAIFNAVMAGISHLADSGQQTGRGSNAVKPVENKQGSTSTDGHAKKPQPEGGNRKYTVSVPAKALTAPDEIDFSGLNGDFNALWEGSFPGGNAQEQGGTMALIGEQALLVNKGSGDAGSFTPNLDVAGRMKVVGTFHTHPYDEGYVGVSLSGADAAYMINNGHRFIISQSGEQQFMYLRTNLTPKSIDYNAVNASHNMRIGQAMMSGKSFSVASQLSAIETARQFNLAYYEGSNGFFKKLK